MGLDEGAHVLGYRLKLDGLPAFTGDLGKARHGFRGMKDDGAQAAVGLKQFGSALAGVIGAYVGVQTLSRALDDAFAGSKALGKFATIFRGDARALAMFSDQIDETARRVGVSDDALLGHAEKVLRAGIDQADAMDVVEQSAKTAQATYEDMGQVVAATTNVLNTYQKQASETTDVQNKMFMALRRGAGTFGDLAEFIGRRGSGLKNVLSLEETLAMAATLGQSGIVGGRALMSIQMIMDQMLAPSDEAKETARALGLEWDFAAMKAQGFGAWIQRLGDRLKTLNDQGVNTAEVLRRLGIESQAGATMTALAENAGKYADILAEIETGQNDLNKQIEAFYNSPLATRDRIKAVGEQMSETFGMGALAGFAGVDSNTVVDRLAETLPKLADAGEVLGRAGSELLNAAIALSGGKDGDGTNWLKWIPPAALAMWAGPKLWNLGKGALNVGRGAWGWATGMSAGAQTMRGLASTAGYLPELFQWQPGLYMSDEEMRGIYGGIAAGRPEQAALEAQAFAAAAPFMPVDDRYLRELERAWETTILGAIEATDSEAVRQSLVRSMESLERTWGDKWAEMSTRLAQEAASHLSGLSLEQLLAGQSVPGQEGVQQSVLIRLDHVMTDNTKDGKNHRARARVSGAGRAEVNQEYRFFLDRDGQGINAVRPLPRDVSFAHVRRGYWSPEDDRPLR